MSQDYKIMTGLELIKGFSCQMLAYGIKRGLDIDGIKIWLSPEIAKLLELNEHLSVEYQDHAYELPVIIDHTIIEIPLGGGKFSSDVRVGNPEWKIDIGIDDLEWWEDV